MVDISRAYFNAKTGEDDPIYVQLPPEVGAPPGMCGLLRRHMYGTRRAAEGWQDECSASLVDMGFTQGAASPCVFSHPDRGIMASVHGDDFTPAGPKRQLDWFERSMKERYELTVGGRLGPGPNDDKEATVLNRVIRWTPQGLEYEADPRQVEKLLEEISLPRGSESEIWRLRIRIPCVGLQNPDSKSKSGFRVVELRNPDFGFQNQKSGFRVC